VARWDADGCRVPTDLFEAAAWHFAVVATCRRCKHEGVFDPHALWWLFERKGWPNNFASAARRLKCAQCGAGAWLSSDRRREPTVVLPMPDARRWKNAISRFRS
jgi:hypothetical protein